MPSRKYTNITLELADEGTLSWQNIAEMALRYMSEDAVEDMLRINGVLDDLLLEDD